MFDRYGRFLAALALAAGFVASTVIAGRAAHRVKNDTTIQVTGSAKRRISSDLVIWTSKVSARGDKLAPTYKTLATATTRVVAYLEKKGLPKGKIKVNSMVTKTLHPHTKDGQTIEEQVSGYELTQTIEVRSSEVAKIEEIANASTELIDEGLEFESMAPEFHYTKIADLKIQMLAEAARDSRVRAEQIATSTNAKLGALRSARMGVIQINGADSTETSDEGNNDTASVEKDVITVVASTFALE
jgi:uncharacterized protein